MNPADVLSEGCSFGQMLCSGWFYRYLWLKLSPELRPKFLGESNKITKEKNQVKLTNTNESEMSESFNVGRYSNYNKRIRFFY